MKDYLQQKIEWSTENSWLKPFNDEKEQIVGWKMSSHCGWTNSHNSSVTPVMYFPKKFQIYFLNPPLNTST